MKSRIESLDPLIQAHILSFCDGITLARCSAVCGSWNRITLKESIWVDVCKQEINVEIELHEGPRGAYKQNHRDQVAARLAEIQRQKDEARAERMKKWIILMKVFNCSL